MSDIQVITTEDAISGETTVRSISVFTFSGSGGGSGGGGSDVSLDADGTLIVDGLTVELATDAQLAAEAALARNADNLTSGTVADARIASTIARDSEVTAAVAAEATLARNADNLTSGTVADARIASTIARDSEVTAAANAAQAAAEATAAAALTAHLGDTVDAHDASAISFSPTGSVAAGDVQAAIAEVASDAAGLVSAEATARDAAIAAAIAALIASAPGVLDTLDEIAAALGDDPNFAATITTALAGKQPLDAELTALAGLVSAADKFPYFTGSQTAALATVTTFARSLLDDADAATARGTLGLGTAATSASGDFQPINSNLTSIAALTTTSYGRAVLELANQAALMALLSAASTTAQGIVELATSAETTTGTDTVRAVTPAGVKAVADTLQPLDADLTTIAGLTATTDNFLQAKSSAWASRTPAQVKTDLSLPSDTVTSLAGKIDKSTLDANTILYATADDTPAALAVAASRIVGRKATGDIDDMTTAEVAALFGTPDGTKFLADDGTLKTPSGGGSTFTPLPLDKAPTSAHAKDDEFAGSSLDGKWTSPMTSASGQGITVTVESGWMHFEPSTTGTGDTGKKAFGLRQAAPTGSFTLSAKLIQAGISGDMRAGIFVGISGGKGHVAGPFKTDGQMGVIGVTTVSDTADWSGYDGFTTGIGGNVYTPYSWSKIVWDAGAGSLTFYWSQDGVRWKLGTSRTSQSQPNEIGIVMYSNSGNINASDYMGADWFRVTEP